MAKILDFRLPEPKAPTPEQTAQDILTPNQALDTIVVSMVCYVMPMWVEKKWPFRALELLAESLRDAMSQNVPDEVHRYQVDAIIEEIKPAWLAIASQAEYVF